MVFSLILKSLVLCSMFTMIIIIMWSAVKMYLYVNAKVEILNSIIIIIIYISLGGQIHSSAHK